MCEKVNRRKGPTITHSLSDECIKSKPDEVTYRESSSLIIRPECESGEASKYSPKSDVLKSRAPKPGSKPRVAPKHNIVHRRQLIFKMYESIKDIHFEDSVDTTSINRCISMKVRTAIQSSIPTKISTCSIYYNALFSELKIMLR